MRLCVWAASVIALAVIALAVIALAVIALAVIALAVIALEVSLAASIQPKQCLIVRVSMNVEIG